MTLSTIRRAQLIALAAAPSLLAACSDTATFGTGTSVGIAADTNTEQVQIGYARAELFEGPNYPDAGDAPAAVGFFASDLDVFSPKIRQLYATGEAARIVTAPQLLPCPPDGKPADTDAPPNLCPEATDNLAGERRMFAFGTGTSLGLKFGFTGEEPSSINLGYDREELSIIPLHKQAPAADSKTPDKYSSVLAAIDLNASATSPSSAALNLTQFFATGAAARNLAKKPFIQDYFDLAASSAINTATVAAAVTAVNGDESAVDAYFQANAAQPFATVRDKLLKDPQLAAVYPVMPSAITTASTATAFDTALKSDPTFAEQIGAVARRLTPAAGANP